ncbi:hypothetical protein QQS21_001718 [Conoideocrella luteorostrata]|uniref:Serine hydrolase domain-containing protein n=1 Tax=Conoideocrella luteorostrata TaxID=1105319 RepID=A0AAJ0D0B8_9HYPO|nr:hypothetical protein QQS21_001718 [Conoideocrella luteorostrata]
MKLLCLHGAYGNAEGFKIQLSPFLNAVGDIKDLDFKWINGTHVVVPPEGYESYFGNQELYRFFNFDGLDALDDVLLKVRDMPGGDSAEEAIRKLVQGAPLSSESIHETIDRLFQIMDEDPEIDGVLGYSEGATVAATLLLEEQRRVAEEGRERQLRMGVFFSGWPPLILRNGQFVPFLADESEDVLEIPTLHIVGSKDPYIDGAMALLNLCDQDSAILFDHGKGHTLPRDMRTLKELTIAMDGALSLTGQRVS